MYQEIVNEKLERETYRGRITPIAWDSNDKPIAFSLFMEDEREFILKGSTDAFPFLQYMNKEVSILGEKYESQDYETNILYCYKVRPVEQDDNKRTWLNDVQEYRAILPDIENFHPVFLNN